MTISLLMVIGLLAVSLIVWTPPLWRWHRGLGYIAIATELLACILLINARPSIWLVVYLSIVLYKLINNARLISNRMADDYLRRVTLRSGMLMSVVQIGLCLVALIDTKPDVTLGVITYITVAAQLLLALILLSSTTRHLRIAKTLQTITSYTDRQLPSISVLIPARNETDDLRDCLTALIASDYPKLEIIVLDDCSQTKRTPEIIRGFAHDGVRFIGGEAPNDSWLAKNFAYQQLAEAANGEYLLFCGVDLRMTPGAIRELITTMLEKQKTMLSILPQNVRPASLRAMLIQPMRYAWEISLPRRLFNRPPVLSTCWIIKRETLMSAGSFKATSRSILPESHFARVTARQDDYSFLRSNLLVSNKPPLEQRATALRMRYPQLHRRLELVWALSVIELIGLVVPLPLAALLFILGHSLPAIIACLAYVVNYVVMLQVTSVMYGRPLLATGFWQPLYDIMLLNYSMYRYEFREVIWKERNICLPIMRLQATTSQPTNQE